MTALPAENLPAIVDLASAVGGVHRLTASLGRFRVLDVVCAEHDARLAQVVGTPGGRVLLASTRMVQQGDRRQPEGEILDGLAAPGWDPGSPVAAASRVLVGVMLDQAEPDYRLVVEARCGRADLPSILWLRERLDAKARRVRVNHGVRP